MSSQSQFRLQNRIFEAWKRHLLRLRIHHQPYRTAFCFLQKWHRELGTDVSTAWHKELIRIYHAIITEGGPLTVGMKRSPRIHQALEMVDTIAAEARPIAAVFALAPDKSPRTLCQMRQHSKGAVAGNGKRKWEFIGVVLPLSEAMINRISSCIRMYKPQRIECSE